MLLQRVAVAEVTPVQLVALRLICAALVLLPFAGRLRQAIAGRPRLILDFFAIGVLNPVLSGVFTALALQRASSGVVAVLQTLSPIATAVWGGKTSAVLKRSARRHDAARSAPAVAGSDRSWDAASARAPGEAVRRQIVGRGQAVRS